jgi:hypothetical protein
MKRVQKRGMNSAKTACLIVGSAIGIGIALNRLTSEEMKLPSDINGTNRVGVL